MADPFSTVVAAVSFVDVTIRTCSGISRLISNWNDASNVIQLLQQTVQNVQCTLECLRLYVVEYESSTLFTDQNQLLPETVKSEIRDISTDLSSLQHRLPPANTRFTRTQKLKWVIDEKKVLDVVRRLDSRQIALMAALQSLAQRNGIIFYDQISGIREELRKVDTASSGQLEEAKSTIFQRLNDITRIESENGAELLTALDGIRTQVKPISHDHAKIMNKLNDISATGRLIENHMQSCNTLEAISMDAMCRMFRAELISVVIPTMETYLDSYKANHSAQLEDIRKTLNQMVSDFGHFSVNKSTGDDQVENQSPAASFHDADVPNDAFAPRPPHPVKTTNKLFSAVKSVTPDSNHAVQKWNLLWRRTWTFRWPIGVTMIQVSLSRYRPPGTRRIFEAFVDPHSPVTRYSTYVSISFRPAPSLIIGRGISLTCKGQQDQRGFYQICPMLATFAVIPDDAEIFQCIERDDVDGLRVLFDAGLAAPTDRDVSHRSLLHRAAISGNARIGEFLLLTGADPSATDQTLLVLSGTDPKLHPEQGEIWETMPSALFSSTRWLVEQGLDVNETDDAGMTPLMLSVKNFDCDAEFARMTPYTVFCLCLLKADASIRCPKSGFQALHFLLMTNKRSAKSAPTLMEIAYILIHFGGADVSAETFNGLSVSSIALFSGWWEELEMVLNRCGLDLWDVFMKEFQRSARYRGGSLGDSTAVDTDEISEPCGTVTKRKAAHGDRLID